MAQGTIERLFSMLRREKGTSMTMERGTKLNGFDLEELTAAAGMIRERPEAGKVTFRSRHEWDDKFAVDGYAQEIEQAGQVIRRSYKFRDDYPAELMGDNSGPAPVENLLASLGACVASTYASQAAAKGVDIEELQVDFETSLDLRGLFRLAPVRPGLAGIRATVRVKSDAADTTLDELNRLTAQTSPIFDSVSNPVPIESSVERMP